MDYPDAENFETFSDVPDTFEGIAFIKLFKSYVWLKKNRVRHRTDGPAIIYRYDSVRFGDKHYFLNDKKLTERGFLVKTSKLGKALYGR